MERSIKTKSVLVILFVTGLYETPNDDKTFLYHKTFASPKTFKV